MCASCTGVVFSTLRKEQLKNSTQVSHIIIATVITTNMMIMMMIINTLQLKNFIL